MSYDYQIYPAHYKLPDRRLMAWLTANGLDPHKVSGTDPMRVQGGMLEVVEFMFETSPEGKERIVRDGHTPMWRKVSVPLVSAPEEHGIRTRRPEAPTQHYVDLRFHFEEKQDFPDEAPYLELTRVTRHGQHYMPDEVLEGMGESFAQSDSWQEFFCHDVPSVLSSGEPAEPR